MSMILPEKQGHSVMGQKDALFSFPFCRGESTHLDRPREQLGNLHGPGCPKDLKILLFNETINADFLPYYQRFSGKIDYKRATEELL